MECLVKKISQWEHFNVMYCHISYTYPQGVEEHQNILMEKQTELAQLQGEHNTKVLETQKLHRALDRKDKELADLQQAKDQLEVELEDLQQQKKKGDKSLNVWLARKCLKIKLYYCLHKVNRHHVHTGFCVIFPPPPGSEQSAQKAQ